MQHRKVYRTRWAYLLAVGIFVVTTTGFALLALFADSNKLRLAGILCAVVAVLIWLPVRRIGVWIEPDGIAVVNFALAKRFRWTEIERFELAPAGVYPFAGHAILKTGRDVPLAAITVPRFLTERLKRYAQEPIDELNALLDATRTDPSTAALPAPAE